MRKDIQINTSTGDIRLADTCRSPILSFQWIGEGDVWLDGELRLGAEYATGILYEGVRTVIPYTPIYKPMRIRIIREYGTGRHWTVSNPVDGSEWWKVMTELYGSYRRLIYASQLPLIGIDNYLICLEDSYGTAGIFSGVESDFSNIVANIQNRNLLLKCVPSNNYHYPTSGVGLVRYLHSNLNSAELANVIDREFKADLVTVNSAAFDSDTGEMELDLDFTEADESV